MTDLLPVTQADRDAVQDFHRAMLDKLMTAVKDKKAGARMGEDEGDAGTLVQAFARHRLAALTQPPETTPVSGDDGVPLVFYDASEPARRIADLADAFKRGLGRASVVGWQQLIGDLNAALHPTDPAAIRNAALEEAARVAEGANDGLTTTHTKIAAAIRGLVKEVG